MLGKSTNQKIDNRFMDEAWQNMSALLDEEMPVEEAPKKRWGFLFLFLGIGFLAGLGAMWMYFQQDISTPLPVKPAIENKAKPKSNRPIASASTAVKSDQKSRNILNNEGSTIQSENLTKTFTSTEKNITAENNFAITNTNNNQTVINAESKDLNQKNAIGYNVKNKAYLVDNEEVIASSVSSNTADLSISNHEKISASASVNPAESVASATVEPTMPVASLPLSIVGFEEYQNDPVAPTTIQPLKTNQSKWKYGVNASVIAANSLMDGVETGIHIDRSISPKLAIQSGLNYRVIRHDQANNIARLEESRSNDGGANADIDLEPNTGSFSNAYNDPTIQALEQNKQDHVVAMPLMVQYQPTGKLRLMAGLNFAFRVNDLKLAVAATEFSNQAENFESKRNFVADRFRVNATGGIGLFPTPDFGIELKYAYQLTNRNIDTLNKAYIAGNEHFWQLGIAKYF